MLLTFSWQQVAGREHALREYSRLAEEIASALENGGKVSSRSPQLSRRFSPQKHGVPSPDKRSGGDNDARTREKKSLWRRSAARGPDTHVYSQFSATGAWLLRTKTKGSWLLEQLPLVCLPSVGSPVVLCLPVVYAIRRPEGRWLLL